MRINERLFYKMARSSFGGTRTRGPRRISHADAFTFDRRGDVVPVAGAPETAESVEDGNGGVPMGTSVNADVTETHAARAPDSATPLHQPTPTATEDNAGSQPTDALLARLKSARAASQAGL